MLRNHSAILTLFLAFAIILAHSVIPHQHDDHKHLCNLNGEADRHDHHEHEYQSDGAEHHNDLGHLLSHLTHPEDAFTFITSAGAYAAGFKITFEATALLSLSFFLTLEETPPLVHFKPPENFHYSSPLLLLAALRAPPFLTA